MRATCSSTWRVIRSRNRASNTCSALRFVEDGTPRFKAIWAHDRVAERVAFEALMDFADGAHARFPRMHVYHYAHYEPSALKRLMSLHGTREAQLDDLLRGEKFVDLYKVVREAIRTSEPGLSIKDVEVFYMPPREGEVKTAGGSIVHYERWRRDATPRSSTRSRATTRTIAVRRTCCATGCSRTRPAELPWFRAATSQRDRRPGVRASDNDRADRGSDSRAIAKRCSTALPADRATWGRTSTARARLRSCSISIAARRSRRGGRCSRGGHDRRGARSTTPSAWAA